MVTPLELDGVDGNDLWSEVTAVSAPNDHTVVLGVRKGQSAGLLLDTVLQTYPVAASIYGQFVIPGLQRDLVTYDKLEATSSTEASSSPAGKAVSGVLKRLTKFAPGTLLGDGPYRLLGITTAEMKLQKWAGFWDASKIHVADIDVDNEATNADIYPMYFSHQADFSNTTVTAPILKRWLHTAGHGYQKMSAYAQYGLDFNDRKYPLDRVGVRQAIAYVIDRPKVMLLAFGGLAVDHASVYPDGVDSSLQSAWLSPSQLSSLNTYPHDVAKAAKLLERLHFTKKAGWWTAPDGKPFTTSITFLSGDDDSQIMATVSEDELTSFGIKATAVGVGTPEYYAEIPAGTFEIAWEYVGLGGLDPLSDEAGQIGTSNNYVPQPGSSKLEAGLGFGPTIRVPGLGKVEVAQTVSREAATIGPGRKMRQLVWDWAQVIDKDLPYLVLADINKTVEYSTYHYDDWPGGKSPIWSLMGLNLNGGLLVALEDGYIRPAP